MTNLRLRRLKERFFSIACLEIFLEAGTVPLTFSGKQGNSPEFETLLEAFDGDKRVVVVSSQEAICLAPCLWATNWWLL